MDNLVTACQPCNLLKGKRVYKSLQEAKEYVLAKRGNGGKSFRPGEGSIRGQTVKARRMA